MDIGIIGLGAVGLFISSKLSMRHDVTGYARSHKQIEEINKHGVQIGRDRYQIRAESIERLQRHELMIVCVKQPQIVNFLPAINRLDPTHLLFIQNGLGHDDLVQDLKHFVLFGVCEHGISKLNSHQVQLNGFGQIKLGNLQESHTAKLIQKELHASNFPVIYDDQIMYILKEKVIVNSVINPLTALFDIPNGEVITNPYLRNIAYQLCYEASNVLRMDHEKCWRKVREVAHNTKDNTSSMLVDIRLKRATEIDSINGYILKQSNTDIPTQLNMYQLIKAKEYYY